MSKIVRKFIRCEKSLSSQKCEKKENKKENMKLVLIFLKFTPSKIYVHFLFLKFMFTFFL